MDQNHKAMKRVKTSEDMDPNHKAIKRVKTSEDRISALPDTVLTHILSYLTTAETVRTSVLSKRWLLVWAYVPVLDLDDNLLFSADKNKQHAAHLSFNQFYHNFFYLLEAEKGSLQKLTYESRNVARTNDWVLAAMKHKVKELDLDISDDNYDEDDEEEDFMMGVPLFVYRDLVSLSIKIDTNLGIPGEVFLPSLKKLRICPIDFSDDETCRKLLSGCPVLEYLNLDTCGMHNVETLEIASTTLKFLIIEDSFGHPAEDNQHQVVLDAPNLEVLKYESYLAKGYSLNNLGSLSEAYISVCVDMDDFDPSESDGIKETLLQLVNGIAHAKFITFTDSSVKALSYLDPATLPIFNNVTKLVVAGNCSMILPRLLENSPHLEVLVLDKIAFTSFHGSLSDFKWHAPSQVPQCLLESLKSVEIRGFEGQKNVLKFVRYLVSNCKVLGELSAPIGEEEHRELKVCSRLLNFLLTPKKKEEHKKLKV